MYVGDPGDSLEKGLYIDFSSTVVLIALKGLSQMFHSIASTHFLRDVVIADDGDDLDDNMEIGLKVTPTLTFLGFFLFLGDLYRLILYKALSQAILASNPFP